MTNDFEVPCAGAIGASEDFLFSERERLQDMRRHIRQQQERQSRVEERKKNHDMELAMKWKEKAEQQRAAQRAALQERLAQVERQTGRARQRAAEAGATAAARSESEGAAGRPALSWDEAAAAATQRKPRLPRRVVEKKRSAVIVDPCDQLQQVLGVQALVRAMMSGQHPPQQSPQEPSPMGESEEKMGAGKGGQEEEERQPGGAAGLRAAKHRNIARRHRLKMMHLVAGQVLQCRQEMAGAFQHAFDVQPADPPLC
mmetsp:Transcript_9383/g.26405  ORF Transcript_9383/g.26405 Transcript_9383/m.26405 type:complete len:257 (-) Transcript_9383:106-876(-)